MNRLKYRVWITPWGSDTSPYMYYIKDLHLGAAIGNWERGGYKDAVFQQYTGLKDKNGTLIYEGDILNCKYADQEVTEAISYSEDYSSFTHGEQALWRGWIGEAEIIGNIFENPELIKTNE